MYELNLHDHTEALKMTGFCPEPIKMYEPDVLWVSKEIRKAIASLVYLANDHIWVYEVNLMFLRTYIRVNEELLIHV